MKIIVVGTGYVGLVHATVCSEYGHEVYGYDIDSGKIAAYSSGKIQRIEKYVKEPGLPKLVLEHLGKYLFFTDDIESISEGTDVIFFCLPAPTKADGVTDLSIYFNVVNKLAPLLANRENKRRILLVDKSTVPIGTAREVEDVMKAHGVKNFGVASNPEFLAEGTAISQARKPDRVVVGCDNKEDFLIMRRVYSQFVNHVRIKYIETTPETAEAIKYIANTVLLTYVSFWNGIGARIAEQLPNIRIEDLRRGVTADIRISTWGSYVSNGAGGSGFGKDIRSFINQLTLAGVDAGILEASYAVNEYQKVYLVDRAVDELGFQLNNKTVAVLGLSFKKQSNDMRDASSIKVIEALLAKGVSQINAYDPLATEEAKKIFSPENNVLFKKIRYFETAVEAVEETDALIVSTDWEEFRGLSGTIENTVKPPYLIIDGRRMIPDYDYLVKSGYTYLAVGSPAMEPE